MNFPFFIAKRYLFTSKSKNVVNIISYISLFGVSVGTAALVIVMSVFNGFEKIVLDMYNSFDPHLKITSVVGKTFNPEDVKSILLEQKDINLYAEVLEEKVLIQNNGNEIIATIKGVDDNFNELVNFSKLVVFGDSVFENFNGNAVIVGNGIAYNLSINVNNIFEQINITAPNRTSKYIKDKSDLVKTAFLPIGVFSVQAEYDNEYIICPLKNLQNILERENEVSAIEVNLLNSENMEDVKSETQKQIGDNYIVKTRLEQHEFLYKLLNSEKLAVFLILVFILIIASFNIISSLSMMMIDKQKDIKTFWNLGSSEKQIRNIFFTKGILGVLVGSAIGLFIGVGFSLLQQHFGFIAMEGNFVVNAYPVELNIKDVLIVEITVIVIGLIASFYPAKVLTNRFLKKV
ncbi:MAG: ABC transporter permease [Flavobacteriales bacterium]|jgi:lipoprotein-releasing system permease protein|nr:ABC transporter permease [Flavobacteriales bacterium]MBT7481810.1 ABC transporter permease [Flavobacteriales bacterium]